MALKLRLVSINDGLRVSRFTCPQELCFTLWLGLLVSDQLPEFIEPLVRFVRVCSFYSRYMVSFSVLYSVLIYRIRFYRYGFSGSGEI